MIHNSKQPPSNNKEASLEKSTTGNDEISANIGVVSPTRRVGTATRPTSEECVEDSTSTRQNTRTIGSTEKQEKQSSDLRKASVSDEANIFQQADKSEDDGSKSHKMQNTRTIESTEKQELQSSDLREASVSDEANIFQQTDKSEDDGSQSHKFQYTRIIESTEKQEQQSSDLREASVSDEANIFRQTDKSEDDGSQSHEMIGKPESSQIPDPENNIK